MATKLDKLLTGTQITDELHNSLGASEYGLDHDTFFGGTDFDIYTAASSGGTHLFENTHYTMHDEDTDLTTEASKNVYTTVKITDPTYQACDLYFTYKTVGDYNEAADVNVLRDILAKSANYTIQDLDRNPIILMTAGAADKTTTLPTVADNTGKLVTLKKVDAGAGCAILDGEGAETIDGVASVTLVEQYDEITVISDGTTWHIIAGNVAKNIAKAWVNFNGTGVVAIRDSFNVSSITDNGVGDYTVNFTNAMSNADYAYSIMGNNLASNFHIGVPHTLATSSLRVETSNSAGILTDVDHVSVIIHSQ